MKKYNDEEGEELLGPAARTGSGKGNLRWG
jgi:hypothetical protein